MQQSEPPRSGSEELRDALAGDLAVGEAKSLNRVEKRDLMRRYRAFRVRAARYRNQAASTAGVGTPPLRIETSLRLALGLYDETNARTGKHLL